MRTLSLVWVWEGSVRIRAVCLLLCFSPDLLLHGPLSILPLALECELQVAGSPKPAAGETHPLAVPQVHHNDQISTNTLSEGFTSPTLSSIPCHQWWPLLYLCGPVAFLFWVFSRFLPTAVMFLCCALVMGGVGKLIPLGGWLNSQLGQSGKGSFYPWGEVFVIL